MPKESGPKVMVAVHGVGDQLTNETVRTVLGRVCTYYGRSGSLPVGAFHRLEEDRAPETFMIDLPDGVPKDIGFAEVYWAKIPRDVVRDGYVLEDARKWAKTIVARVQAHAKGTGLSEKDCLLVENVLEELIDTVQVVDRLCFLADKAGLFTFSLQRILDDFVNDVQLVADFGSFRGQILDAFRQRLASIVDRYPDAEIYIIAHSEGTVVTLAGLLSAMRNPGGRPGKPGTNLPENRVWLDRVRGVMTIGSPLDTHMLLWRSLWVPLEPGPERWKPATPIVWHNYYDRGDPIADSLRSTRQWLDRHYPGAIDVTVDHGFSRFYFPGKAHIDYWEDEHVFGYFIEEVTGLPAEATPAAVVAAAQAPAPPVMPAPASTAAVERPRRFPEKPPPNRRAQIVSYLAPYALIGLLCFVAVFVLYKSVTDLLDNKPGSAMWRDVATLALLLAGMTIAVRIPRLSSMWRWRLVGIGIFALAVAVYVWPIYLYDPPRLENGKRVSEPLRGMQDMIAWDVFKPIFAWLGWPASYAAFALPIGAAVVVGVCMWLGRTKKNRWGIRFLLIIGGVLVVIIVAGLVLEIGPVAVKSARVAADAAKDAPKDRSVWPVILASAGFFYLWWLAALLFDLVFVWHRYIRHSAALGDLRSMQPRPDKAG